MHKPSDDKAGQGDKPCRACKGTGKVTVEATVNGQTKSVERTCPVCAGTKKSPGYRPK